MLLAWRRCQSLRVASAALSPLKSLAAEGTRSALPNKAFGTRQAAADSWLPVVWARQTGKSPTPANSAAAWSTMHCHAVGAPRGHGGAAPPKSCSGCTLLGCSRSWPYATCALLPCPWVRCGGVALSAARRHLATLHTQKGSDVHRPIACRPAGTSGARRQPSTSPSVLRRSSIPWHAPSRQRLRIPVRCPRRGHVACCA